MGYVNSVVDGIILGVTIWLILFLLVMIPMEIYDYVKEKRKMKKIINKYKE